MYKLDALITPTNRFQSMSTKITHAEHPIRMLMELMILPLMPQACRFPSSSVPLVSTL